MRIFFFVLQVGTLDQLVGLSDDLGKLDAYVENITRKVAIYLGEVLEDQRDKLQENLLANNSEFVIFTCETKDLIVIELARNVIVSSSLLSLVFYTEMQPFKNCLPKIVATAKAYFSLGHGFTTRLSHRANCTHFV